MPRLLQARQHQHPQRIPVQRHPVRRLRAIARRAAARRQQTAMPVVREIRRLPRLPATPPVRQRQGDRPRIRSQNRAIDYALKKGKGYAGRCQGDTFYVQLMLMLKYATKNSDVLGGCWQYTPQTAVTNAETGVKRVIIATSAANNFDVGSTVNVGTDKERNNTDNYSAARARTILSKTNLDAGNTALNLDGDAITTTTACFVNTMPWKTGATDKLLGTDGRPSTASAANHQPSGCKASNYSTASTRATPTSSPTPSRTTTTSAASNSTACSTSPRHPRPRRRTTPRSANSPHATRPRTTQAIRRGLHPVQRRHHPHGTGRDEHHRHVRRHRGQPAHIPRPPTGAALRHPRGWGCLRRFRRVPLERPRVSQVVHRGPPVCARSHEA